MVLMTNEEAPFREVGTNPMKDVSHPYLICRRKDLDVCRYRAMSRRYWGREVRRILALQINTTLAPLMLEVVVQ